MHELYADRKLSQEYPGLEKIAFEKYIENLGAHSGSDLSTELYLRCVDKLLGTANIDNVLVLGCGPKPESLEVLAQNGYEAVGVEPVQSFLHSAREYLGAPEKVLEGSAEKIPLASASQDMVICESVLEHVESPTKSLDEVFRVLSPGGLAFVVTTNRHRVSLRGENGEYNVRFFNWLPNIVKESFVFQHLHYDPSLANYTVRPAVHWYSYADLCKLGREAGFYKFYSILDLLDKQDPSIAKSRFRTLLLDKLKFNPWLRALALTQLGAVIIMLKRQ